MAFEGKVWIGFVVKADGSLTNFSILRGVAPMCDNEALRVAKLMPKWIPGKQRGKPVCVHYQMSITFKLE
jgi:protein TonB